MRSGTTLALKVLCPGLTPAEVEHGSAQNEPPCFWEWLVNYRNPTRNLVTEVNAKVPELMEQSRHHVVKSPHATPILSMLDSKYRVIITFRDIRLVAASMLNHMFSREVSLTEIADWRDLLDGPTDLANMSMAERAILGAYTLTRFGTAYHGKTEVWNYGFWDEWKHHGEDISGLYGDPVDTPKRVRDDVAAGKIFSDASFSMSVWEWAREKFKIPDAVDEYAKEANAKLVDLYRAHGLEAKTLDDRPTDEIISPDTIKAVAERDDPDMEIPLDVPEQPELMQRIDETWGKPECPTDWIQLPSQRRWEYETIARMLDVPPGSRVLDAGGGGGYMSYILSSRHSVVFNDRHDCYKQPPAPVQKIIGSFFTLPEHEPFDAIACVSVLEHVPPERRLDWFEKLYRMLKPGGVAAMSFEWHHDTAFDIGDGIIVTTAELEDLFDKMSLKLTARLVSPTRAVNSRGWLPMALRLVRG